MRIHRVRDTLGLSGGWMQQVKGALAGAVVATGFNGLWKSIHTRHEATPPPPHPGGAGGGWGGGRLLANYQSKTAWHCGLGLCVGIAKESKGGLCLSIYHTRSPAAVCVWRRGGGGGPRRLGGYHAIQSFDGCCSFCWSRSVLGGQGGAICG